MPYEGGRFARRKWPWWAAMVLAALALPAWAASPFEKVFGDKAAAEAPVKPKPKGPSPEEQRTLGEIRGAVDAGQYEKAISLARTFVRNAKSETLKTEATRLVAAAQRKKKDWDLAQAAYLTFRDRHPKGAGEYVRANAIVDILRASRDGVYYPLVEQGGGTAKTLDDDTVLGEALACLAKTRAERLKVRLAPLQRAQSVQKLLQYFLPLAEELRHLRLIWPERSPTLERSAIQAAATRLEVLSAPMLIALKDREAEFKALRAAGRLNTSQQADMLQYVRTAEIMVAAENSFLEAVDRLDGTTDWPEGLKLIQDASARRDAYAELAKALTPGTTRARDQKARKGDYDWRRDKGAWDQF